MTIDYCWWPNAYIVETRTSVIFLKVIVEYKISHNHTVEGNNIDILKQQRYPGIEK